MESVGESHTQRRNRTLRSSINRHYLFAFLKHELFKTELLSIGARSDHRSRERPLAHCRIPFPAQRDAADVIAYVAALTEAIS